MSDLTVQNLLAQAQKQLPKIETEILLSKATGWDRVKFYSHPEAVLQDEQAEEFFNLVERRILGEPVAYIVGEREFWGLNLQVSPATLIPRADTETLVETALSKLNLATTRSGCEPNQDNKQLKILDLGTGSGAIALALKSELPEAEIMAVDFSTDALEIAEQNSRQLGLELKLVVSDWLTAISPEQKFDLILSNPPYIEPEDPHLSQGDLRFEPQTALVAEDKGLRDIQRITTDSWSFLNASGWLMFEHGYNQAEEVAKILAEQGFQQIETVKDLGGNPRVTFGQKPELKLGQKNSETTKQEDLTDDQLMRYSRQILLPEIDVDGQLKLQNSHALILGLGGLGSPVALYLAAAGVGELSLVDFDEVEISNLQRQIIHNEQRLGSNKAESAAQTLAELNPACKTHVYNLKPSEKQLAELIEKADLVLDCTDNFEIRFMLNQACFAAKKPLVSGAAIRFEGQVTTYDFRAENAPCYECLYPKGTSSDQSCSRNGVVAPLVGMVGSIQALEAIKTLLGLPNLNGKLMLIDGLTMQIRQFNLHKKTDCDCCC